LTALPKGTTGLRRSIRSTRSSTPLPVWGPLAAALAQTRDLLALRLAGLRRGHVVRHHPGPNARRPRRLRFA